MNPIKHYHFPLSGHSHRVQLMLSLLGLPVEEVFVDLTKGAHKQADFLALNAFGQVPVIDDDGVVLADSNAILVYLAHKYGCLLYTSPSPRDRQKSRMPSSA